jgi:hypothetical protein
LSCDGGSVVEGAFASVLPAPENSPTLDAEDWDGALPTQYNDGPFWELITSSEMTRTSTANPLATPMRALPAGVITSSPQPLNI